MTILSTAWQRSEEKYDIFERIEYYTYCIYAYFRLFSQISEVFYFICPGNRFKM